MDDDSGSGMAAKVEELGNLKAEADRIAARIRALKDGIDAAVEFEGGKKSATLFSDSWKVTIHRKNDIKWDQDRIEAIRARMPEDDFFGLFKWEYRHASKKVLDAHLARPEYSGMLAEAFTEIPRPNSYIIEPLDEKSPRGGEDWS
jgi:hypothetical protein